MPDSVEKIEKGAGRLKLVREQGARKHQQSEGSKKNVKKRRRRENSHKTGIREPEPHHLWERIPEFSTDVICSCSEQRCSDVIMDLIGELILLRV